MVKSNYPASQVIVDPQELTEFLRASRDITELADEVLNLDSTSGKSKNKDISSKEKRGWKRFAGILLALLTGICFTVSNLIVKYLKNHHPVNLSFWRYFGFIIPILPYIAYMRVWRGINVFSSIGFGKEGERRSTCCCCGIQLKWKNLVQLLVRNNFSNINQILRI